MKPVRYGARPQNADVRRKIDVGTEHPRTVAAARQRVEMDHLITGMHPGIGSAGTLNLGGVISNAGNCTFYKRLDGALSALRLPAAELGAVVLDSESDTHGTQDTSATSVHRDSTNPTLDCR